MIAVAAPPPVAIRGFIGSMGMPARDGRPRVAHRAQGRPNHSRPSRLRTRPARLLLAVVTVAGFTAAAWPMPANGPELDRTATARAAGGNAATAPATGSTTRQADTRGNASDDPTAGGRSAYPSLVGSPMDADGNPADHLSTPTRDGAPVTAGPDGYFDAPGLAAAIGGPSAFIPPTIPSLEPEQLTGYVWPLREARITRWFEESTEGFIILEGKAIHDGVDLATFCGHAVLAAHSGTVLASGRDFSQFIGFQGSVEPYLEQLRARGEWMSLPRVVVIDDGNGYRSVYVHLGSQSVRVGDRVKAGDVIGKEGATGHASGCHLHYTLIRMDGPLVPVAREFVKQSHYPAFVRERIDPMRVLSFKLRGHARRIPGRNPPKVPFRYVASTPIALDTPVDPFGSGPHPV
jgi:murein DD-endopeptidase MepM/ murein hydrolase activator NlpD